MLIGVVSDTHIPRSARSLPAAVVRLFAEVDLILHAGDLTSLDVLHELQALAPVVAVHGNMCELSVMSQLPGSRVVTAEQFNIGLTHGHVGKGRTTPERALNQFQGQEVDCVVFGHSHQPFNETVGEVLLFNPGSPTDRRWAPVRSVGLLRVTDKIIGELVKLK